MGVHHSIEQTLGGKAVIRRICWGRGGKNAPPGVGWQVTVVDACCYGRKGMKAALQRHPCVVRVVTTEMLTGALSMQAVCSPSALVLRLPMLAQEALSALLQLGDIPVARYARVVVMSNVAPDVVHRVLTPIGVNSSVWIVDARCTLSTLCRAVISTMGEIDGSDEVLYCEPYNLLSQRERYVLGKTLREISIYTQARQAHVSAKTIYTQRARALLKLGAPDILGLLRQFVPLAQRGEIDCDVKRNE
ncbi:helix-turn-helix transcriptional regulator [Serratia fonticola]